MDEFRELSTKLQMERNAHNLVVMPEVCHIMGIKSAQEEAELAMARGAVDTISPRGLEKLKQIDAVKRYKAKATPEEIAKITLDARANYKAEVDWVCSHPACSRAKDGASTDITMGEIMLSPCGPPPSRYALNLLLHVMANGPKELHSIVGKQSKGDEAAMAEQVDSARDLDEIRQLIKEVRDASA